MSGNKKIAIWLFFTAFMVFAMAVIGAITRLTESGLSMVEWRPLIGTIPPMNAEEWQRVFDLYRETPEYQKKNAGMSLDEFQYIFFWEWFHRFWGRLIGLVYALPFFWFLVTKQIPKGYHWKLFGLLILGGLQGVMGWYMVQSGLIDRPSVSHYRLAAHLSLAFLIFGLLIWVGTSLVVSVKESAFFCLRRHGWSALFIVALTAIWGAFVAGLDGGLLYNSWPKMGAHWIPIELNSVGSLFADPAVVQFVHRWIAIIAAFFILAFWYRCFKNGFGWPAVHAMGAMVFVQVGLGLATLLTQVWIPLAALHQAGAFILTGLMVYNLRRLQKN